METESQESTPAVIHDEIVIDNSDSEEEANNGPKAEFVRIQNEKDAVQTYENNLKPLPKVNNNSNSNILKTPVLTLRHRPTEWQTATHIKLHKDVKATPLHVEFKENVNLNSFYGFSNSDTNSKDVFQNMLSLYNTWRRDFNAINNYNRVEERNERVPVHSVTEEDEVEVEESRERTPNINDSNDFPTLGVRPNLPRSASLVSKTSTSKQIIDSVIDVDEDSEPKEDPDDVDFVHESQSKKKKNKKVVYKKVAENIFDFNDSATAWNSSAEVAESSKRVESKVMKAEPVVPEKTVDCPICCKPFPMSQIENHASDCSSFEDAGSR